MDNRQPWVVGLLRGAGLAVVGALTVYVGGLTEADVPNYLYAAVPLGLLALRELEALIMDQRNA